MAHTHHVRLFLRRGPNSFKIQEKADGSSGNAVPSKRLDLATSDVTMFHCNPDVRPAPKDSVDANIILTVSSDLPSGFS